MSQKASQFQSDDRYRRVAERRILDLIRFAGWNREGASAADGLARQALDGWIALGLPFRSVDGARYFDPVEMHNFIRQAGLDGRDGFWRDRLVGTARGLVEDLHAAAPSHFQVALKRTFHLAEGRSSRLRLPLPLDSDHLTGLTVEPFCDTEARLNVTRGRLEARLATPEPGAVTLGAQVGFAAAARGPDGAPRPDAVYLKPRDGLIVVTDRIAALARRLAGPGTPPRAAVRAFWDFCLDECRQGGVHYDQLDPAAPVDSLLDGAWGDCQLVAALFCALCRASAIPARLLSGNYLYRTCPTNHYWAEAWIDGEGWTPFDFLCWELSAGGRDGAWRDVFFGRLEPRLTSQCLPLDFTGATGITLPPTWHILQWASAPGEIAVGMLDEDARPLYTDFVSVSADSKML